MIYQDKNFLITRIQLQQLLKCRIQVPSRATTRCTARSVAHRANTPSTAGFIFSPRLT